MEANTRPERPYEGDGEAPARARWPRFARAAQPQLRRLTTLQLPGVPSIDRASIRNWTPYVVAISVVAVAVTFVAALTYVGARQFSGTATDARAADEAQSFAQHSSRLATGDAFDGYIQILRFADDPAVRAKSTSANDRTAAMQQLLYLNVNKFSSLTVADRGGLILATTDSSISGVKGSAAFSETRANLGPANSDIVLPEAGKHGYVEYTAPLKDADGTVWAVLLARADPARIWKGTLLASVDDGRNVIVNSEGQFAAGVPDELLRQPWRGIPLPNGSVRANIAGIDAICGLAPIGRDTQIDRGLNIASCLPASLIHAERGSATRKQLLVTIAAAMLAFAVAAVVLKLAIATGVSSERRLAPADGTGQAGSEAIDVPPLTIERNLDVAAVAEVVPPASVVVVADVDALTLIDAYERRSERLADRLRETVQAKLLIATTQADEAWRLAGVDPGLATSLHSKAMSELEAIRERELRAFGQDLYPGLIRLGLPGALKALKKEVADLIDIKLDLDFSTDSVALTSGRTSLEPSVRLVMYRFAADAARLLTEAGAWECTIALNRYLDQLVLAVSGVTNDTGAPPYDEATLEASRIAAVAHAGSLRVDYRGALRSMRISLPVTSVDTHHAEEDAALSEDEQVAAVFSGLTAELGWMSAPAAPEQPPAQDIDPASATTEDKGGAATGSDESEHLPPDSSAALPASRSWPGAHTMPPSDALDIGTPAERARTLATALETLQADMFGSMVVGLDVAEDAASVMIPDAALRAAVVALVRQTLVELRHADARHCTITLTPARNTAFRLCMSAETEGDAFDATPIEVHVAEIAALGSDALLAVDGARIEVVVLLPSAHTAKHSGVPDAAA